jgi:YD repeat-containing protein
MSKEATNWSAWSDKMRELTTQELIDRLTKERDEAREQTRYQYNRAEALEAEREEAEGRGFERGVREAAKITEHWHAEITAAILALLEKDKTNG